MPKGGLGKGLGALLPVESKSETNSILIPIKSIMVSTDQPRKLFTKEALDELAASIKEHGILQPILVRPYNTGYQVVAGERRLRAANQAGLKEIPAIIREIDDDQAAEIALVENLQREDLTPIEEAAAYKQLIDKHRYTQEAVAEKVGRSRTYITNMIRLLVLPEEIQQLLISGELSIGHARALISLPVEKETMIMLAKRAAEKGYTVRQIEQLAREQKEKPQTVKQKNNEYFILEQKLQDALGTKARIVKGKNGGKIEIIYYSDDDLDRLIEIFKIEL
ncbi:MAG: ParB/RepB/Spo0J family partition protein [Methylocystaceae bacterium]